MGHAFKRIARATYADVEAAPIADVETAPTPAEGAAEPEAQV